eukprot:GHVO01062997.1.p1 GENE.GHVO01062997.1~~GHVO01062997.1.p1  ORF type:complete len:404 (-),score=68.27 GHVO01062997.1:99-1205(-)
MLMCTDKVLYLETDLGQPLFGPSGVVSLWELTYPILSVGGEHWNATQPGRRRLCAYWVGFVAGQTGPSQYLEAVAKAYTYRQGCPSAPMIVNSHGWIEGLGIELTRAIQTLTGITMTIHLGQTGSSAPDAVIVDDTPIEEPCMGMGAVERPLCLELPQTEWGGYAGPTPAQKRWLRIASHFQESLSTQMSIPSIGYKGFFSGGPLYPRLISLNINRLKIQLFGTWKTGAMSFLRILRCLPGMLIAMGTIPSTKGSPNTGSSDTSPNTGSSDTSPNTGSSDSSPNTGSSDTSPNTGSSDSTKRGILPFICYGYVSSIEWERGYIRAIDVYVPNHVSEEMIGDINSIGVGDIKWSPTEIPPNPKNGKHRV